MSNDTVLPKGMIKWIVAGAGVLIVLIVILGAFFTSQDVISQGNRMEATLSAQYANGANYLSTCIVKTKQAAGTATAQTKALQAVYASAVAGRYDNDSATAVDNGKLFSAIQEAYPDTSGLDKTFQIVVSTINGCRDDYAGAQTQVQDSVRAFNAWRTGSLTTRLFGGGFPNDQLYVQLNGTSLRGQAALDKISVPIVDTSTDQIYKTGTFEVTDPFANN